VAVARRAWFARRAHAVRRLPLPVVSVGNLVVGGSGKTPVTAHIVRLLLDRGERPAILSRGYARREHQDGVVVVSDGRSVLEPVERAGDEPFMLAHELPEVPVLVCDDRYLAGQLAWRTLGATVAVLDDGFQHLRLARDVNLLLVRPDDLRDAVLPAGRLREPLSAAKAADAVLVPLPAAESASGQSSEAGQIVAKELAARLGVPRGFSVRTAAGELRPVGGHAVPPGHEDRVVAVCGIARPQRFLATLEHQGWRVADTIVFKDHHWFSAADLQRIDAAVDVVRAAAVLTTEKDAVRLKAVAATPRAPWWAVPLEATIEPGAVFADWLASRVRSARAAARHATAGEPR
jgi:tetraacyldisaccharide 4'-kinase